MNEDLLQDLFDLMPEGIFESPEEMKPVIESEGIDGFFDQMPDGAFFDIKEYQSFFKGLKKKENSQLPVLGKKDSELVGEVVTTDALLDSNEPSSEPKSEENKFWFEQLLGNIPVASGSADFFGDMIRAGQQGYAQGQSVDDAIRLFAKAANASEEDIDAYISAVEKMEAFPESDEMKEFSKLYQEGGGGIYGFMKGIIPNPSVINQVFTSSIVSMMNPTVLGGAATGAVTGAGVGAAVGAAGGPLAAFTGAGGAMTGAMMGAGGTLEVGLSFTEFLKEELDKAGLEFNKESVKEVLEDPEALQRIRNKSAARGVIIGLVDGITMGVAGEVGATVTKAAIKAGKSAVVSGARGVATATLIEGGGGSAGEMAARAATGQKQEASDILFEGIAGQVSTVLKSGPQALGIDVNVTKPGSFLRPPSYSMTGEPQTKADIEVFIETMTPEQIRTADITIKNDPELQAKVDYLKQRAQTDLTISEDIVGEDRNTMIDLEMQILNMKDPKTESSKIKLQNLKDQIRVIIERNGKTEEQKNREKAAGDYKKTETTVTSTEVNTKAETDKESNDRKTRLDSRNKNLFEDTNKYNREVGKSNSDPAIISDVTSTDEKGVATATYVNPDTGDIDVIVSGKNDKNFVGYVRVYENGKPTNMFTAKMESTGDAFKNMITSAEAILPDNAEVVETTSISEGGLKVYNNSKLTEKLDENGNVVTRPTQYSAATKESVEQDGQSAYNSFKTTDKAAAEAEVAKIKAAYPGVNATINERKGKPAPPPLPGQKAQPTKGKSEYSISIDLPVLTKPAAPSTEVKAETKKFQDSDVILKEETFTVIDKDGGKTVTTVRTNLDGSLRKAEVESFDADGNSLGKGRNVSLADNDIVVRDGLTAEQILTDRLVEGQVIEKTERSGNEINNPKKTAQLTTDQKQKLGIPTQQSTAVEKPVLTKSKTNAVQESSTTQVDVQESTQDSKEMGIGNISSKPTGESNIETESEVTETEETEIENVLESPKLQEALTSEVMDDSERKNILLKARRKAIEEGQEESRLYSNIMSAINREAKTEGINANEYIKAEVIEDSLPTASRERVNKVIDNIIKKTKERRDNLGGEKATLAELFSNTSSYLQQSKLYEQLNDVEREAAIRELNERLGIKEKRAPSSRKVAMGTDKKVVVNERVALKDQIKLEAKAARESAQAYKKSLKDTATYVKGLVKKGLINTKQAAAILAKQANVNVFNQKSVDSFIEYVDNVFNKAELADKISRSKDLKSKAKKNVGGAKTGNIPQALKTVLEDLFSISPYLVPLNKIDAYLSLLEQFGSNKKTLDLEQRSETMEIAQDVLNAVQEQIETNEDGSMVNFEIVKSKKKNYDLGAVTNEIIENKITEEEIENLTGEKSKEVARKINKLTAQEIAGLSKEKSDGSFNYGMIETLREVKNNLKNGFAPKAAFDIITEVESNNSVKPLVPIFNKIKKTSVYRHFRSFSSSIKTKLELGPSAGNFVLDRIRSMPAFFVDDVLGNFNSKDVYNATFKKMAVAYSSFETEVKTIRSLVNEADVLLDYDGLKGRKFLRIGRSRNKVVKAKYKLMLVQLTREHLSNYKKNKEGEYVGNPKAPSGEAFLDVTIKDGKLNSADIKILEELKEEFLSGDPKVDLKKLEKSLSESEKKALKIYGDINGSLSEKAIYVSSQLHGEKINLINDYVHHSAINTGDPGADVIGKKTRFQNAAINTKAGTIVERTNGAKPISFDPSYSAMRGAQETLVDYYMTPTNRVVQKTINKLNDIIEDNPNNTKESKKAAKAIKSAMNEINGLLFEKTFTDVSIGNEVLREAQSLGYKAALSSAPRAGAELVGNVLLVAKNPILATKALTNFSAFANGLTDNSMAMNAMAKLQSSETSRLYDSNTINNKYSDLGNFMGTSQSSGKALTPVLSMGNQILKLGSKQLYAGVDYIATKILTTPDKAISRPMWFGTFQAAFSEATKKYNGESVELTVKDFKAIADGTSPYLSPEFQRAVEAARNSADKSSVTISTSSNPYNSVFKNIRRKDSSGLKNAYRVANSYMANFSLFEYGTARNALYSLVNSGDMSSGEALKVLTGVTARMSSYMVMYTLLTQLMDEELFDVEDDDSEEDFEYLIARQLVGAGVSLVSRGQLGNIPLIPFNMLIEEGNERFGEELRDGEEYNKYKHSLVFNQIGKQDLQEKDLANNLIGLAAGPFGPLWKTLSRSAELLQRTQTGGDVARKKAMDELTTRMAVEVSGNLGLFPFYKDYRRIMLKSMFGTKPYTPAKSKKVVIHGRNLMTTQIQEVLIPGMSWRKKGMMKINHGMSMKKTLMIHGQMIVLGKIDLKYYSIDENRNRESTNKDSGIRNKTNKIRGFFRRL